jgi:hypothetical protein
MLYIIFIYMLVSGNESMNAGNIIFLDIVMIKSIEMFHCFRNVKKYKHRTQENLR